MRFTIRGWLDDHETELVWEDGELWGDARAIVEVDALVGVGATVWATPTGPHYRAALEPADVALLTIREAFDHVEAEEGDVPEVELEELPEGAIP